MNPRNFFAELKRRNVYKVAVAYAVVAWLLLQGASIVLPSFEAPGWTMKVLIAALAIGFPIAVVLAWAFEITPDGIVRAEGESPNKSTESKKGRKLTAIIIALGFAALGLLLFQIFRSTSATTAPLSDKSIAVMPLVNQSGDPAQEYFSDGLSEELINGLGQIHELRVIGRNSSFHFKGKSDDSRAVGQALGVANLIEGSVRKSGDRLRVIVQLVDVSNGSQRWSQTYDRELKDIFAVQEEIAKSIADQLRVTLLGGKPLASSRPSNQNLAAYNAYLQGKYFYEAGNSESTEKAVSFLDEAIRLDPNYAEAHILKARAWYAIAMFQGAGGKEAFEKARAAVKAGLALKPNLPTAHSAMAYIYIFGDWNLAAAEAELSLVQEKDTTVLNNLGTVRSMQGRQQEALLLRQQALPLEPADVRVYTNLGSTLLWLDRLDEAEAAYRKALQLRPEGERLHSSLAIVAMLRGQRDVALREAELERTGSAHDMAVALARFARGDRAEGDSALQQLIETHGENFPFRVAAVYGFRKEPDKGFEWLDHAYSRHDPRLIGLLDETFLRPYQSDPRFAALCNKMGLPVPK